MQSSLEEIRLLGNLWFLFSMSFRSNLGSFSVFVYTVEFEGDSIRVLRNLWSLVR